MKNILEILDLEFLERVYYRNTVQEYLISLGIILLGIVIVKVFKNTVIARIKRWTGRTRTVIDDYLVNSFERYGIPIIYVSIIYFVVGNLTLSAQSENILSIAITMVITVLVVRFLSYTLVQILQAHVRKQHNGEEKVKQLGGLKLVINMILWFIGLGFLFDNLGYDLTTVIAGLGIGGIAIALAAQNILGDLFNYFVIFIDRPVEVDDFIIIDDKVGTVEHIGVKTTRLKSISGEQLIFANSDLTKSRIHNYKRMKQRRVVMKLGVTYQTPIEVLKQLPEVLRAVASEQELVAVDRSHFTGYGDFSLNFELVYYVLDSDFIKHMDVQQAILFRIHEEFSRLGAEFAYPTRTLYLKNQQDLSTEVELQPEERFGLTGGNREN